MKNITKGCFSQGDRGAFAAVGRRAEIFGKLKNIFKTLRKYIGLASPQCAIRDLFCSHAFKSQKLAKHMFHLLAPNLNWHEWGGSRRGVQQTSSRKNFVMHPQLFSGRKEPPTAPAMRMEF
jgi:hypothetical protein